MNKCLTGVKETLKRLNIKHDLFVLEGEFVRSGAVDAVVDELMQKIDVFGKDHELVSQQLTKALALLSVKAPEYVIFAFVSLPSGSLSTRAGRYISADELMDNRETELIKMLSKFEYIVEGASLDLKPHRIAKYARELAEYFNLFYKYCPVLNAEDELRKARLALVDCARIILCDALDVLGIEAPEEM